MPKFEEVRTVTADGRVVIPWVIQRALGLDHGGMVRFQVDNGVVTLIGVDRPRSEATPASEEPAARPGDVRRQLAEELNALLAISRREPVGE